MDECEFKAICIYDEDLEEKKANCSWEPDSVNDCPHHKYFKLQHDLILNSPQFKKQYAKIPKDGKNPYEKAMKNIPRTLQHKREELRLQANAYAEGQQNPDPKQYANHEELVEAIEKAFLEGGVITNRPYDISRRVVHLIRTHGKEE